MILDGKRFMVIGGAGLIGSHTVDFLLKQDVKEIIVYDNFVRGKEENLRDALKDPRVRIHEVGGDILQTDILKSALEGINGVFHFAALWLLQCHEFPRTAFDVNIKGTFNVIEAARQLNVNHLLLASTSSVYGANVDMPFNETQKTDTPLTIYAATKKATERMAHSYSHLYDIPTTMFRFFTVYGPWGRPDMALFKFTKGILNNQPIDIYNNGEMQRDFTFVIDLVRAIMLLINAVPIRGEPINSIDSLSSAAPYRVVNIGNSQSVKLMDFIEAIEEKLGMKAIRNYMPMQIGDVPATWADSSLLQSLTGYCPQTDFYEGVASFIDWYRGYYNA